MTSFFYRCRLVSTTFFIAFTGSVFSAQAAELPTDTEPCEISGWSVDPDPSGLNVRAAPSTRSRVIGTLPPPFRFKGAGEAMDEAGYRTKFDIVGYRNGWFLIEGAVPPGRRYYDRIGTGPSDYPPRHPKTFQGRGWVSVTMVGAQYANGGTRMGGLFAEPREDADWMPAHNAYGGEISADGGPKRIISCRGPWAEVESHDGKRGWWRKLCSNQVTNCS